MEVVADHVSVTVDGVPILTAAALQATPGRVVGVVGPNGSGKSTFLGVLARSTRPLTGTVLVGGTPVWSLRPREAARRIGVLPQSAGETASGFSVEEVVALGRLPRQAVTGRQSEHDRTVITDALERCGVDGLRHRLVDTLSGGERQRVLIARAIAQQPRVLILDEPSNHLDIGGQLELLDLVRRLGLTVVTALHDLNLALAYCDDLVLLRAGRVLAAGRGEDVLTEDAVRRVYGVRVHRGTHPLTGRPLLAFAGPAAPTPSAGHHETQGANA
jgi:iron complex transport system ATP-binding protein